MFRRRHLGNADWNCPLCNVMIFGRNDACKKCKTPRVKAGDWICRRPESACAAKGGEFNFAARAECRRCRLPKPEVCVCSAPRFRAIIVNAKWAEGLGGCDACLLPNPISWYEPILDKIEEEAVPKLSREHWCYCLTNDSASSPTNVSGLGRPHPKYAWISLFQSRANVTAELKLHAKMAGVTIEDARQYV